MAAKGRKLEGSELLTVDNSDEGRTAHSTHIGVGSGT